MIFVNRIKGDIVEFLVNFSSLYELADREDKVGGSFKELARLERAVADASYDVRFAQVTGDYQRYGGVVNLTKCLVMRIGHENRAVGYDDILKRYQASVKREDMDSALKLAAEEGMIFEKEKGLYTMPFSVIVCREKTFSL